MDEDLNIYSPSSLEDLGFQVSYKEILSNLILCCDHRPKEKQFKWLSSSSLLSTISHLNSDQLIAILRSRLDHYLLGIMGDKIRKRIVEKFHYDVLLYSINRFEEQRERKEICIVDPCAFLDCVLDESFEELKTYGSFPGCEPNPKLMTTIVLRSPLVKKLELNFSLIKEGTKLDVLRPMIQSLESLEHLVDLTLHFPDKLDVKLRSNLLSLVGNVCPFLTRLVVYGNGVISKKEVCGLLMGEWALDTTPEGLEEPKWLADPEFSRLKVPEKFLSPICFKLRELCIDTEEIEPSDRSSTLEMSGSSVVFILRHLPLLEKLTLPFPAAVAIKTLHEQSTSQVEFEKDCGKAFSRHLEASSQPTSKSLFSGSLSLTEVDDVNAFDKEMLRAVGFFCPLLKDASFFSLRHHDEATLAMYGLRNANGQTPVGLTSPDELETILNEWPKLTTITLDTVPSEYVASVLKVFGAELTELNLYNCEFHVRQLLSCPNLEILRLTDGCTLLNHSSDRQDPPIDQSTFLPKLKKLHSKLCFGSWSHLFENKSTLESLFLFCCHIGCKDNGSKDLPIVDSAASQSDWNQTPQMWPRLKHLEIQSCAGLTMTMFTNLAPQFPFLKYVELSGNFLRIDHCAASIELYSRKRNALRNPFPTTDDWVDKKCPYVEQYEKSKKKNNQKE